MGVMFTASLFVALIVWVLAEDEEYRLRIERGEWNVILHRKRRPVDQD